MFVVSDHSMDSTADQDLAARASLGGIPDADFLVVQNGSVDMVYLKDRAARRPRRRAQEAARAALARAARDGSRVDEALYREPERRRRRRRAHARRRPPRLADRGRADGDLFVTHTRGRRVHRAGEPAARQPRRAADERQHVRGVGGGTHRAPAVAGGRGRRPLRRHAAQPGAGPERRRRAHGAGAARALGAARQRGPGPDRGLRAGRLHGDGRGRGRRRRRALRRAGAPLRARAARGSRLADRLPPHRRRARRRGRVPPVARADDSRQPPRGELSRALAELHVAGARRAAGASTSCACGPAATCGGWRSAAARGASRARPAFERAGRCDVLRLFKLEQPVFGGRGNRAVDISFRLRSTTLVAAEVLRRAASCGAMARRRRAGTIHRLRLASERLRAATTRCACGCSHDRTLTSRLVARRL